MYKRVVYLFFLCCISTQSSSATKMGEIMSMGIPLITNSGIGDSDLIIQKSNCGIIVELDAYRDMTEIMERLSNLPSQDIRLAADEYYSLEKGILKYDEVYTKLIGS